MLVLSRRQSDQVIIPSLGITLEILSIKGNVVKLGIAAPQEVRVLRGEVAEKLASNWGADSEAAVQGNQQKTTEKSPAVRATLKNETIAQREIPVRKPTVSATQPLRAYVNKGLDRQTNPKQANPNSVSTYPTSDENGEVVNENRMGYEICV